MPRRLSFLLALTAGVATVFAFAPFGAALLPMATLGVLFLLWQHADTGRAAACHGWAFGLGLFGAGASWVYIALETFGGMPAPVAAISTFGFVAYLALWPAVAGWLVIRLTPPASVRRALAAAAAWTLAEWLRGYVFTGFPWLTVGYSQLPASPLAALAPVGGVWLVSLAVALAAAAGVVAIDALAAPAPKRVVVALLAVLALFGAGSLAGRAEWTRFHGETIAVSLVQGNVPQSAKFDPAFRERNLQLYAMLAERSRGRLVVLPESALPMFSGDVPEEILARFARTGRDRSGDVLVGMFTLQAPLPGSDEPRIHNSVVSLGTAPVQVYRKYHLVPFGETIPLKAVVGWFLQSVLAIPLADQTPGPADAPPFEVAGQRVAVNICYEDAFGDELRVPARTATLLINVTNDAWYGRSLAAWQHNQIAAMRALETGRPMLRATNTGVTSAIAHDGRELGHLPWFTRGILEVEIAGREGETPYVRYGDIVALLAAALVLVAASVRRRRLPVLSSAGALDPDD
jgi:apolipoprotein N-acyltransferase